MLLLNDLRKKLIFKVRLRLIQTPSFNPTVNYQFDDCQPRTLHSRVLVDGRWMPTLAPLPGQLNARGEGLIGFTRTKTGASYWMANSTTGSLNTTGKPTALWRNGKFLTIPDLLGPEIDPSHIGALWDINDHGLIAANSPTHGPALLVPVQIEARKQGTTAAPETGLLVKKGDVLEFAFAPQFFDTEDNFESLITWQYRQLKSDGTYTGWTDFGSNGTGTKFQHKTTESGIFQIKVSVHNTGEHFYVRRKSDPDTSEDHELKKGEIDSVGVADTQIQIDIVSAARADLGSTAYAVNVANGFFEVGTNKCNLFVAEKAQAAGATVPYINFEWWPPPPHWLPPVANQWAGIAPDADHPVYSIAGWSLLSDDAFPQPGFIVASGYESWSTGHAGIVDYDGRWISAGPGNVNRNANFKSYKIRTLTGSTRPAGKRKYTGN